MTQEIVVIAKLTAKKGQEQKLAQECRALVEPSRSEKPCIAYDFHTDPDNPRNYMFYEVWKSKADLDTHLQTPYLKHFQSIAGNLLDGEPDVTIWKKG